MEHHSGDSASRSTFGRLALPAALRRLPSATAVAVAAVSALAAGGVLVALGHQRGADIVWAVLVALLLVPLCVSVVRTLLRGDVGVDAIALIAMGGALALGEYLAGAVIALMLAGGNALEERAGGRARRELTALVSRAPRRAARVTGETLEDVPVEEIGPGDLILVRSGEVIPADGVLEDAEAVIDESALTGEALPVVYRCGQPVRSGTVSWASHGSASRIVQPIAPTQLLSGWPATPRRSGRRSFGWPIGTPPSSCRSPRSSRRSPGQCRAIRCAH